MIPAHQSLATVPVNKPEEQLLPRPATVISYNLKPEGFIDHGSNIRDLRDNQLYVRPTVREVA